MHQSLQVSFYMNLASKFQFYKIDFLFNYGIKMSYFFIPIFYLYLQSQLKNNNQLKINNL
jgi:hypothetical protein